MRCRWFPFLVSFLLALPLSAQSGGERIWLHTDAPAYQAGDRIHFKAYVLSVPIPVEGTVSAWLSGITSDGRIVAQFIHVR